ncbi:SLAP domain-containing protein [Exiguobacterium flavidum]|uniref:SLAP domain-containing protein n=1 Tax=Exiguobacterium flavidum TaxID=2184695 RepID=UPI000DF7811D|nr:SLAP domain-containing protein [Exiguobacterium flavidum]
MFNRTKSLPKEQIIEEQGTKKIRPRLVFTEDMAINKEDEYMFRFHATALPPLEANQLSVEPLQVDAGESDDPVAIIALFRNTLDRPFHVNGLPLLVLDESGRLVARKELTDEDIHEFVPMTSMPWWLHFEEHEVFVEEGEAFPERIRLLFSLDTPQGIDIGGEFDLQERRRIERIAYSTPALTTPELNILLVHTYRAEGHLAVTVLVRNGYEQEIRLESLPVELFAGETPLAKAQFKMTLTVPAQSAKPIKLLFPSEMLAEHEGSDYRIHIPQN